MSPLSIVSLRLARAEAGQSGPPKPCATVNDSMEEAALRCCSPTLWVGVREVCARRMENEQRPTTAKMTASSTRTRKTTTRARAKRNEACEDRLKSVRYREGIRDNSQTRADHRCSPELRPLPASLGTLSFPCRVSLLFVRPRNQRASSLSFLLLSLFSRPPFLVVRPSTAPSIGLLASPCGR